MILDSFTTLRNGIKIILILSVMFCVMLHLKRFYMEDKALHPKPLPQFTS
jgi:hypothetical protein